MRALPPGRTSWIRSIEVVDSRVHPPPERRMPATERPPGKRNAPKLAEPKPKAPAPRPERSASASAAAPPVKATVQSPAQPVPDQDKASVASKSGLGTPSLERNFNKVIPVN